MLKRVDAILIPLLVLFGAAISFVYGRVGYMPLDQSIVFDGGWRVLSGQLPFRDFTSPAGFVPIFMQAGFFRLFGVSWTTYLMHAAVLNGLFCVLVYLLLRRHQTPRRPAFLYGLLSGVVFYPPFGVPYMEQHAFFFATLAITLTALATHAAAPWTKRILWSLVSVSLALAYLSKQIPTIFAPPVILLMLWYWERAHLKAALLALAAGGLAVALTVLVYVRAAHVSMDLFRFYYFTLPGKEGPLRILMALQYQPALLRWNLAAVYMMQLVFWSLVLRWGLRSRAGWDPTPLLGRLLLAGAGTAAAMAVVVLAGPRLIEHLPASFHRYRPGQLADALVVLALAQLAAAVTLRAAPDLELDRKKLPLLLVGQGLLLICFLFSSLTRNQAANGIPLVFAGLGFFHLALCPPSSLPRARLVPACLVLVALFDAVNFNQQVNRPRLVHDYKFTPPMTGREPSLPPELSSLVWSQPFPKFTAADLGGVSAFFKERPGNFLLVGDASVLYGITGRPSVNPSLWYHYGLSIPLPTAPEFAEYQRRLMENMRRYQAEYVVLEYEKTEFGASLADFTLLQRYVEAHRCDTTHLGGYTVIRLCPAGSGGQQ